MQESEILLTNELQIPKEAVDMVSCFQVQVPKMLRGHAEDISKYLYLDGGYVAVYRGDNFWTLSTKSSNDVPSPAGLVEKRLSRKFPSPQLKFKDMPFLARESILFEMLKLHGHKQGYFHSRNGYFIDEERIQMPLLQICHGMIILRQWVPEVG